MDDDDITRPIFDFVAAWAEGSGDKMGRCFTDDAYFVAFDGTRLKGGKAIGEWHQPALDTVLRGTRLDVRVDEIQRLAPDLALVASSGGAVDRRGSRRSRATGESHEVNLVRRIASGEWKLAALQVTRRRPIHGLVNALVWQAFDAAWATLVRPTR